MTPSRWFEPQRNIVHRFIAYLVLLSIVPLLVLGTATFEISRSTLRAETERHLEDLVRERKRYVDLHSEQTVDLITNVSGVETITAGLAAGHERADNYDRLSMQARIGYILNGYVNIKGLVSIDVFSLEGAHYHVGDTLDTSALRRRFVDELQREAAANTRPVHWAGLVDNVNGNSRFAKVITTAKVMYGVRAEAAEPVVLGLLLVNYDPAYLRGQFGESAGGVKVALIDAAGQFVVHPDAARVGTMAEPALLQRLDGDDGRFQIEMDGQPTLVAFRRTEPSGWPIVGFVPLAATNVHAGVIGHTTVLVALLCLAVAGLAALLYSRSVVAPLRTITDRFKRARAGSPIPHDPLPVHGEDDIAELTRGFNAFLEGLHERRRAEQALQQAESERQARLAAEAANDAKSVFLARMSHDLRTPLNAVLGYAQLLEMDKGLTPRQLAALRTIRSSGAHLLTLISDILDLSKIEAGKLELHPEEVDLAAFCDDIAATIRVKAESKRLVFDYRRASELPRAVRCDPTRLRQVLLNLLDNAVKFTDAGRVGFDVQLLAGPPQPAPTAVRFEVEDTGVGIAADRIEASFHPFEQVGDTRRRAGGTGLGLAIARQLVRLMGGDIEVRSAPDQGSRFRFDLTLPRVDGHAAVTAPARTIRGYRGPKKHVLVVDDVAENRTLAANFLAPLGFDVSEAGDGRAGIEQAQAMRPDLILMDIVMPVMDGLEATRRLRLDQATSGVPIVAISAVAAGSDRARALAAGADAFLAKPIDFDALVAEIGRLLNVDWRGDADSDPDGAAAIGL